ncbi:hypothetical protein CTI12_AA162350 [Artemisia annua]|uniref:Uncharacterized protein n=1 Tax=Artemisia annua TaxID=35608 RepID=A0A2U1PEA9_ARTAN|nr:hypothetical protein CTI12_AA162350 [Artemisia annua]
METINDANLKCLTLIQLRDVAPILDVKCASRKNKADIIKLMLERVDTGKCTQKQVEDASKIILCIISSKKKKTEKKVEEVMTKATGGTSNGQAAPPNISVNDQFNPYHLERKQISKTS